jgi:hypothetical protein
MNIPLQSSSHSRLARLFPCILAGILSLTVSVAILIPFFIFGTASGHDFEFHAASWLDVAQQWREGIVYPRWAGWANHGFGEPRFIFYPPLSWMLGAALTFFVRLPWVPTVYLLLTQTFAGISAFALLRRLTGARAALLGAVCYAANPDALLMTYIRSDFAEQLACSFFPLLFLATLELTGLLNDEPFKLSHIPFFAISFAAVWLCNAPAGVIASYSVAFLMAWAALAQRSWRPALRGACGLLLGFGLAGFYLLPAAYEQRWVNIAQALSSGLLPWENFLFTAIADAEHTWFNWIASICALLILLLLLSAALASRKFAAGEVEKSRKMWGGLLALAGVACLLMLRFTLPLWNVAPKLRFVQFPWRWMSVLAVIFVCFLAAAMERKRGWLWMVLLLAISVPLAHFLVSNGWWDEDEMPTQQAAIRNGSGFDGTDEYDPVGDDHADLPVDAPLATPLEEDGGAAISGPVQVMQWSTEKKKIRVEMQSAGKLAVRLLNYPAWKVQVNGVAVEPGKAEDSDQMVIELPAGQSDVRIWFGRTRDRTVGIILSLFAAVIATLMIVIGKREEQKSFG